MNTNYGKVMLRSLFVSYLLSLILLFVLTFLCYQFRLPESQISITVYAVYVIACLLGGLLAGKSIRQKRFLWGMLSGILYFAVLFLVSWFFAKDSFGSFNQITTIMAMCIASGTIGGMLS